MSVIGRPVLSRELIAQVALQLTEAEGLANLSMRKLGAELGVEAMSLYHYVDNKNDLLVAMTGQLYAEIELPALEDDVAWDDAVRGVLRSYRKVLVSHSGAVELFLSQPSSSSGGLEVMTWVFELFTQIGLSNKDAVAALHFAVSFAMGHAVTELSSHSEAELAQHGLDGLSDPATPASVRFRSHRFPPYTAEGRLGLL